MEVTERLIIAIQPSFAAIHLPHCRTPESYRYTEQVAEKLFFFGQWNPNQCNCRSQCLKMLYTSSLESTTDRFKITKGRTKARVRIYYQVRYELFIPFSFFFGFGRQCYENIYFRF